MKNIEKIKENISGYHLPKYNEIPDVGLYLEQVVKYINTYLSPLSDNSITNSMVSNYVKKGIVSNPVKKQYSREQIATLIYIAICKFSLSLEDIGILKEVGLKSYSAEKAYTYFCNEFEMNLYAVFDPKNKKTSSIEDDDQIKVMLRTTITAVTYQIYLNQCFKTLYKETKK